MTENLLIESATLRVTNSSHADREYDMAVTIGFNKKGITQIDSGYANKKNGQMVATFNSPSDGNTNFTFYVPASEQAEALAAINSFVEAAKAFASEKFSFNNL